MQLVLPTPTAPGLLERPAPAAGVAELNRSFDLLADAVERLAEARATGDAAAITKAKNGLTALGVGAEVAVSRLAHRLNAEIKRTVKDVVK